jgi:D-3-phosphoglycerate dehydrogenase / 2-oxoglutarate reductase
VRVVVTDHVFADLDIERAAISELGGELEVAAAADEDTLVDAASRADALLVCYATSGARVIEAAASNGCKVIARYGIGVDNIDVEAASHAGIRVTNVPDYCVEEVADHTLALILLCARQLLAGIDSVRSGAWDVPHGRIHRIAGRRLALLGLGRIGRSVLERALSFGLEVVGYDPFLRDDVPGLRRVETAEEAVAEANFVSVHAPLTEETHHLIGEPLITAMGGAPVVVNTSRGGLVDSVAALRALDAGVLSGLALDVTEEEPLPYDSPLRSHPRVVITPHMAFYSVEAERILQRRAIDEVVHALQGKPAVSAIN